MWLKAHGLLAAGNQGAFRLAALCLLGMSLLVTVLVLARYGLGWSSIPGAEAVMYLHALCIALGLAGTWQRDGHVRIDIFYRRWSPQGQLWLNRIGLLLLGLPYVLFLLWSCWDYVLLAWERRESSAEPGGLPWLWLLKSVLLLMPLQLLAAALWLGWKGPESKA